MQRRTIMTGATTGLAALATPALAQPAPAIRWRMATSWPNSLDALQGSAVNLCKRVGQLTDGRFEIRCFAGGELMPALQVMDAVQAGTIECEGSFQNGKGAGTFRFTGNPGFVAAMKGRGFDFEKRDTSKHHDGETEDRLFAAATSISHFEEAHSALLSLDDEALQKSYLRRLVEKMCETGQSSELITLPFSGLQTPDDRTLVIKLTSPAAVRVAAVATST